MAATLEDHRIVDGVPLELRRLIAITEKDPDARFHSAAIWRSTLCSLGTTAISTLHRSTREDTVSCASRLVRRS
jgi:hypothetical protein